LCARSIVPPIASLVSLAFCSARRVGLYQQPALLTAVPRSFRAQLKRALSLSMHGRVRMVCSVIAIRVCGASLASKSGPPSSSFLSGADVGHRRAGAERVSQPPFSGRFIHPETLRDPGLAVRICPPASHQTAAPDLPVIGIAQLPGDTTGWPSLRTEPCKTYETPTRARPVSLQSPGHCRWKVDAPITKSHGCVERG